MSTIEEAEHLVISAAMVAKVLIVAGRRNVSEEVNASISGLGFEIISVTAAAGRRVTDAYSRWGKGIHPASLATASPMTLPSNTIARYSVRGGRCVDRRLHYSPRLRSSRPNPRSAEG